MGIFDFFGGGSSVNFNPETDIPALTDKVILITGGNTGLGKETVLQLAKHQPRKIFLAARNEAKAKAAIEDIHGQLGKEAKTKEAADVDIEWLPLDLASLASVKAAADSFHRAKHGDRLDILILNAGIMAVPPGTTDAGFDTQVGTNHVGHFLLTKLLLPTLLKTAEAASPAAAADVRIVSVASVAQNFGPRTVEGIIDIARPKADDAGASSVWTSAWTAPWVRYGASKAANVLLAAELARRHGDRITSTSLHPGVILTDLYLPSQQSPASVLALSPVSYLFNAVAPLVATDVPSGALNQLYLAAGAAKDQLTNGAYYTPVGRLQRANRWANDREAAKRLWDWTEEELTRAGY